MSKTTIWIRAARPHTLPLALSCIGMGNLAAYMAGSFSWPVFMLSLLTAILLQVLSNLANDYGDFIHGVDSDARVGPRRTVQSGLISAEEMKKAIQIITGLSLIAGVALLISATGKVNVWVLTVFLLAGLAAVWAAWNYTASSNPYGYRGLGDLFVFLFFGWVAVTGPFILQTGTFYGYVLLPASAFGLFSTAVLNLNNLRDLDNDAASGKITIAVRLGKKGDRIYHSLLILSGLVLMFIYFVQVLHIEFSIWIFIPSMLLLVHPARIFRAKKEKDYYPLLKELSLLILIFTMAISIFLIFINQ